MDSHRITWAKNYTIPRIKPDTLSQKGEEG